MSSPVNKNDYIAQARVHLSQLPLDSSHDEQVYAKAQSHLKSLENPDIDEETWLRHQTAFEAQLIELTA